MSTEIIQVGAASLVAVGQAANAAARAAAFAQYLTGRTANSRRAQRSDLQRFADFLVEVGVQDVPTGATLQHDPTAWQGVTHGLVLAFREWLLGRGYAIASVNRALSTVKGYARLAGIAEGEPIQAVTGLGHKQGRNRDKHRAEQGIPTRVGAKKPYKAVSLSYAQAKQLKQQPDTPQGRRDALLMALLLDHGLRCGEVAGLRVTDFDAEKGLMTFYRPKVDKSQTHRLTLDTLLALKAWLAAGDAPALGPILRGSRKGGALTHGGMSVRAITQRVRDLGRAMGIERLSAHDCRHYWATRATRQGTHPKALQQAGGWNSPAMVMRYVDEAEIANEGVIL